MSFQTKAIIVNYVLLQSSKHKQTLNKSPALFYVALYKKLNILTDELQKHHYLWCKFEQKVGLYFNVQQFDNELLYKSWLTTVTLRGECHIWVSSAFWDLWNVLSFQSSNFALCSFNSIHFYLSTVKFLYVQSIFDS